MAYYKIKLGMAYSSSSAKEIWAGLIAYSPEQVLEKLDAVCLPGGLVVNSGSLTQIGYKEYQQILNKRKQRLLALGQLYYSSLN